MLRFAPQIAGIRSERAATMAVKGDKASFDDENLMFGANTTNELRGDYTGARPDFTIDQDMRLYSAADQEMWRRLYKRQSEIVQRYACDEFLAGLKLLDAESGVPSLERISDALYARTRWRLVAVPGFIPDVAFFEHLSQRRLP